MTKKIKRESFEVSAGLSRRRILEMLGGGAVLIAGGKNLLLETLSASGQQRPRKNKPDRSIADAPPKISNFTRKFMSDTGTPGVAIAVYESGRENIYCFGDARTDPASVRVTPETVFGIGSVTKTFTSTLLAYQVDTGGLQLDDSVVQHLPPAVRKRHQDLEKVTLVMLATHTAGFPKGGVSGEELFKDEAPSPELVQWWQDWRYDGRQPLGTHYAYSNVGMITLGFAVAGDNYSGLLQRSLCGPLGMSSTAPADFLPRGIPLAQGHLDKGGRTKAIDTLNTDLNSSPQDMLLYLKAQLGVARVPAEVAKAIALTHREYFNDARKDFSMGLGWQISNSAPKVYTKNGGTSKGGCGCWIGFAPKRNFGLVVMGNKFGTGKTAGQGIATFGAALFTELTGIKGKGDIED
jgi:beta-lactamase class C